jgi:Ca2+-binding EF-hand superfamily protein
MHSILASAIALTIMVLAGCATPSHERYPTPPSMKERFRKADTDGNGRISRDEFVNYMITDAFSIMDKNGNASLTLSEYLAGGGTAETFRSMNTSGSGQLTLAEAIASPIARSRMAIPFDEADVNGNGSVSWEEFQAYRERVQPFIR